MSEWKPLYGGVPPGLESLTDGVQSLNSFLGLSSGAVGTLQPILDSISQRAALFESQNPLIEAITALTTILDGYVTDILGTGAYFFPLLPGPGATEFVQPFPTSVALTRFSESLSDRMDSQRPRSSDQASYAAVVFLGGTDKFHEFADLFGSISKLLGEGSRWVQVAEVFETFQLSWQAAKPKRGSRATEGAGYDWTSFRVGQLKVVEDALLQARAAIDSVALTTSQPVGQLTSLIRQRLDYYTTLTRKVAAFLDFAAGLGDLATGLQVLPVASSSGGVAHMQNAIVNASGAPNFQYCTGFVLASVGPDMEIFKAFAALLGVPPDSWD